MVKIEEFLHSTPKICVPIMEKTLDAIVKQGCIINETDCDIVEWRVDCYEGVFQTDDVIDALCILKDVLEKPILFTFRTSREGGEREISKEQYGQLLMSVIESKMIDLIDVEAYFDQEILKKVIAYAHQNEILVIASNHEFGHTPEKEEIIKRLMYMKEAGADIPKIAVMPKDKQDVLTLMNASICMREKYNDQPIITMSMGELGKITRFLCQFTGSVMTFSSVGITSAPGQIALKKLEQLLVDINGQ